MFSYLMKIQQTIDVMPIYSSRQWHHCKYLRQLAVAATVAQASACQISF